jgi:hypothetical protein
VSPRNSQPRERHLCVCLSIGITSEHACVSFPLPISPSSPHILLYNKNSTPPIPTRLSLPFPASRRPWDTLCPVLLSESSSSPIFGGYGPWYVIQGYTTNTATSPPLSPSHLRQDYNKLQPQTSVCVFGCDCLRLCFNYVAIRCAAAGPHIRAQVRATHCLPGGQPTKRRAAVSTSQETRNPRRQTLQNTDRCAPRPA